MSEEKIEPNSVDVTKDAERSYIKLLNRFTWFLAPFWVLFTGFVFMTFLRLMVDDVPQNGEDLRWRALSVAALVATLGGLVGAPLALIRTFVTERQTKAIEAQRETAEQGLITDRFTKAVEQLGAEKTVYKDGQPTTEPNLKVRLGALYALERIAQDSERDHIPIMETLCAYVRENSNARKPEDFAEPKWEGLDNYSDEAIREAHLRKREERFGDFFINSKARKWARSLSEPRADIQAALRIIGRRSELRLAYEKRQSKPYRLDLRSANLQRCDLSALRLGPALLAAARLEGANLSETKMDGAVLGKARMEGADLGGAKMEGISFIEAKMEGADLGWATCKGANFRGARMDRVNLREAELERAVLGKTTMARANLRGAKMVGAYLGEAKLDGASLRGAKMERADLREAKMDGVDISRANLRSADLSFCKCARINARATDFTGAENVTQEQINTFFGDCQTKLPAHDGDGSPLFCTTLLNRRPLEPLGMRDTAYQDWLDAGAPPGTPIIPD